MKTGCSGCIGLVVIVVGLSIVLTVLGAKPPIRVEDALESTSSGLRASAYTLDPTLRPTPTTAVVWIGTPAPR